MPNRIAFTQLAVEKLKPPATGRAVYWDKMLPGFGLRISAPRPGSRRGRRTWITMGRVDGKAVMGRSARWRRSRKSTRRADLARAAY